MKKEINIEIGDCIRQQRESLRLTREQLAELADLSAPFLADVELGRKGISPSSIQKLCDALHVSADYLIRSKQMHTDFSQIMELLSGLDAAYIPLVEDLVRTYIKSIHLKPSDS